MPRLTGSNNTWNPESEVMAEEAKKGYIVGPDIEGLLELIEDGDAEDVVIDYLCMCDDEYIKLSNFDDAYLVKLKDIFLSAVNYEDTRENIRIFSQHMLNVIQHHFDNPEFWKHN